METDILWQILAPSRRFHWHKLLLLSVDIYNCPEFHKWWRVTRSETWSVCAITNTLNDVELQLWLRINPLRRNTIEELTDADRCDILYDALNITNYEQLGFVFDMWIGYDKLEWLKKLNTRCDLAKLFPLVRIRSNVLNAITNGNLDILKWLIEEFNLEARDIDRTNEYFPWIVALGYFDMVKFLVDEMGKYQTLENDEREECISGAIKNGHLSILQWLIERYKIPREVILFDNYRTLRLAADCGHIDIFQWLMAHYQLTRKDLPKYVFLHPMRYNRLRFLKWLHETYQITKKEVASELKYGLNQAAANGHLELLQWVAEVLEITPQEFEQFASGALYHAAVRGQIGVLDWIVKYFNLDKKQILTALNCRHNIEGFTQKVHNWFNDYFFYELAPMLAYGT